MRYDVLPHMSHSYEINQQRLLMCDIAYGTYLMYQKTLTSGCRYRTSTLKNRWNVYNVVMKVRSAEIAVFNGSSRQDSEFNMP